ncbi:restriction endonuclease subunit S [Nitrosarchaeum sp. AC2]|uniref:restriction endonuclease subunit S n=1 Tax=Nitrosarchaeum sp. AC2 TaxID=2259673 RepID=UPI0015C69918|nr:restriction endonuclease subunit S [Nitrosarchaeum sp. AC2]
MKSKLLSETNFKGSVFGSIPVEWEIKKISELDESKNCVQTGPFGSLLHSHDYQEQGHPLILVQHVKKGKIIEDNLPKISDSKYFTLSKFILKEGDIVFTRVGYVGDSAFIEKKYSGWLISGQMLRVRLNNLNINNRFVSLLFTTKRFQNISKSVVLGSTRDSINTQILKDMPIIIPSKHEQDKIVSIIHPLNKWIENVENQNKILEKIIQSIFKSWFIDFEGQTEFVDSELGQIPKGWIVSTIPECFDISPNYYLKKGIIAPYIGMADIPVNSLRISDFTYREFTSGTKFTNGDTLLARITPSLENGKTAYVDFLQDNQIGWGSTEFIVMRPKDPFPKEYGYCLSRTNEFRSHAILNMTGTSGRQRVPESCFDNYNIVIPSKSLLDDFRKISSIIFKQIKINGIELNILTKIRDSLLPKLMSGEIRV